MKVPGTILAFLACVGSLSLSEITPASAILAVLTTGLVVRMGLKICAWAGLHEICLGVGFAIGSAFFVFFGQLLLISGVPAQITHPLVISTVLLAPTLLRVSGRTIHRHYVLDHADSIFFCLAIGLLVISTRHPWLL